MNHDHRNQFIESIVRFFERVRSDSNGKTFAGIDIDWEPNSNQWDFAKGIDGKNQLQITYGA